MQMFRYIDIVDNTAKSFSGLEWLYRMHLSHSIIFMGNSGLGKTPVADGYAAELVRARPPAVGPARFYRVSDLEALDRHDMQTHIPVIWDELRPDLRRQHNPPLTTEAVKVMMDCVVGNTVPGKGTNGRATGAVCFADGQPRLATTNAVRLSEFLNILPDNLFDLPPAELAALPADTRAVLKRVAFFLIPGPHGLLPAHTVGNYRAQMHSSVEAEMRQHLAGANAIP